MNLLHLWCRYDIRHCLKGMMYTVTVRSVLYGCETWSLHFEDGLRLSIFHHRRFANITQIWGGGETDEQQWCTSIFVGCWFPFSDRDNRSASTSMVGTRFAYTWPAFTPAGLGLKKRCCDHIMTWRRGINKLVSTDIPRLSDERPRYKDCYRIENRWCGSESKSMVRLLCSLPVELVALRKKTTQNI